MYAKPITGVALGGAIGAVIGYFGKCNTGACPLTSNPIMSAIFGMVVGALLTAPTTGCSRVDTGYKSPNVLHVASTAEFDSKVLGEKEKPVLVDFYADWCGPCRAMSPAIEKLADETKDWAVVTKVNVDKLGDLTRRYNVTSIPNLKIFLKGEVVKEFVGVTSGEELKKALEQAKP